MAPRKHCVKASPLIRKLGLFLFTCAHLSGQACSGTSGLLPPPGLDRVEWRCFTMTQAIAWLALRSACWHFHTRSSFLHMTLLGL